MDIKFFVNMIHNLTKYTISAVLVMISLPYILQANDEVLFVNGSTLTPIKETDIAVKKEILTIKLADDGFAYVEVDYQFWNAGNEKTVTVGFEAQHPTTHLGYEFYWGTEHPNIKNFSVTMNGKALRYKVGCIAVPYGYEDDSDSLQLKITEDFQFLNPSEWRRQLETDDMWYDDVSLFNSKIKKYTDYAYAYYFDATFHPGLNIVKHTYRYSMSFGSGKAFEIPYWLTPAMKWSNRQIDDFTLRIVAENTTKHFLIFNNPFKGAAFQMTSGKGKMRIWECERRDWMPESGDSLYLTEVVLRNGVLEWHAANYHTDEDLLILSADELPYWGKNMDENQYLYYDSGITFNLWNRGQWYQPYFKMEDKVFLSRILRKLPYAHRGYVFKDKKLQQVFESQWWYMPDPTWKPQNNALNKHEYQLIKNSNKITE